MKIILSRKGFDSASGGVPSPVFPDGTMLSLPIPDKASGIAYKDISGNRWVSMGEAVSQLAGIPSTHRAHLDPDLLSKSIPRSEGWRPLFGQVGAPEGHLRKQGVANGDIFLFFGLFRSVEKYNSRWRYVKRSTPFHSLFGWLQIDNRMRISEWPHSERWAQYHPHFARQPHPSNVLYTATRHLTLFSSKPNGLAGAGIFTQFSPKLRLTAPDYERAGRWLMPQWFYPEGRKSVLSFHSDFCRWKKTADGVYLTPVCRGQEFVLDCCDYPEAMDWLRDLFRSNG